MKYINKHLTEHITVSDLVKQVPLSRRLLEIRFKGVTQQSIQKYIFSLKIERFAQLLLTINAPIQGSAADIIKVAMVRIYQRFQSESIKSKMILQVHDELNFSVLPEEKEKVQKIVIEEMENAYRMQVPLRADCGWGSNWLEAH